MCNVREQYTIANGLIRLWTAGEGTDSWLVVSDLGTGSVNVYRLTQAKVAVVLIHCSLPYVVLHNSFVVE